MSLVNEVNCIWLKTTQTML